MHPDPLLREPARRRLATGLLALAAMLPWPAAAQGGAPAAAAPLPAELFFAAPSMVGASLAPSGRAVAVVVGGKDSRDRLAVLELDTMKLSPVASFNDADVNEFRWVNDRRLVFNLGLHKEALADRRMAWGLYAVNSDGSGFRQLAQRERVFVQDNIGTRQLPWNTFLTPSLGAQNGDEIVVVRPEARDFATLLRLDTVSGRADELDTPRNANAWLLDAQGNPRAARSSREQFSRLHWRDPANGQWRQLREYDRFTGGDIGLLAVEPDGRMLVVARPGRDLSAVYRYDPAADRLDDKPLLAVAGFDADVHEIVWRDDRVVGLRFLADAEVTHWLDPALQALQAEVDKRLASTNNVISIPRRGDSPWVLVRSFSDLQPALFHAYNRSTQRLVRLGQQMPAVQPARMATVDFVRYKARDGLEIPAYLTLPPGAAGQKNLPLLVYVHGGPYVRGATWGWQAEVQFLASRGYAVLQPEFRGSRGFGMRHFRAGFKQWGQAMQDDLADGARWAVAQGLADPKRICILGASYGGYAALMGLVKDGDLFRCGISWVGVSDILLMYDAHWSDLSDEWKRYGMPQMVGDREKDAALLAAHSPLQQAARIRNPLLLGHGRIDRRVPIEHGQRIRDAVKAHNPAVEWVQYDKEGHGWSLPETDVDWWTRVEAFLARHIPAAAPAARP
jgi:dipeptidyl aminopeptidase/acylaminoacyl peptidase